jgi:hypothetical protein
MAQEKSGNPDENLSFKEEEHARSGDLLKQISEVESLKTDSSMNESVNKSRLTTSVLSNDIH